MQEMFQTVDDSIFAPWIVFVEELEIQKSPAWIFRRTGLLFQLVSFASVLDRHLYNGWMNSLWAICFENVIITAILHNFQKSHSICYIFYTLVVLHCEANNRWLCFIFSYLSNIHFVFTKLLFKKKSELVFQVIIKEPGIYRNYKMTK